VLAVNRTYLPLSGLTAQVEIFNLDSKSLFHEEKSFPLSATEVKEVFSVSSELTKLKGVNFVVLNLKNTARKVISHNVYWLSDNSDFKSLNEMQKTKVDVKVLASIKGKDATTWTIQITNPTKKMAFFIRPQLIAGGEEILPSYWTSGYFTLAPSETTTVSVSCPAIKITGKKPIITVSGWNVNQQDIKIN
jgi:hypothetical protein